MKTVRSLPMAGRFSKPKKMKKILLLIAIAVVLLAHTTQAKQRTRKALVLIAYHAGNINEISGMFFYVKAHHLRYVKSESVKDVVINYFSKS